MPDYNYKEYEKLLEKILELSQRDYWTQYIDINSHQVSVGKTYLWVAAALLGSYMAVYQIFHQTIHKTSIYILFLLISTVLLAVISFGICLYSIPARRGYHSIPEISWGEFSQKAYKLLSSKQSNSYIYLLTDLIDKTDAANVHNLKTNAKRAYLLRLTSWLLIASFILALFSTMPIALAYNKSISNERSNIAEFRLETKTKYKIDQQPNNEQSQKEPGKDFDSIYNLLLNKEEISMPNSIDKSASPVKGSDNNQSVTQKPDVPPPAGPIGQGVNITTHGENNNNKIIRMTEDIEKSGSKE